MVLQIAITLLITGLIILAEHYLPWRMILGRKLPRVLAYIAGVLAIALPLSGLFLLWGYRKSLIALWAVIATAGVATFGTYAIDQYLSYRHDLQDAEERENQLRNKLLSSIDAGQRSE